jgi:hypothetical protein
MDASVSVIAAGTAQVDKEEQRWATPRRLLLRARLRACPGREGVVAPTELRDHAWARVGHSRFRSTTVFRRIRAASRIGVSGRACGGELERHDIPAASPMKPTAQPPVHAVAIGVV